MKICIGTDHAGFELKEALLPYLKKLGYDVYDKGAFSFKDNDDYPDYIIPVAEEVSADPENVRGIVIGGSGQGEAICANRFPHVRAVVFNGQYRPTDGRLVPYEIMITRQHNNANVLSLGARFLSVEEAKQSVKLWLETPFSNDLRHMRRLKKIDSIKL